MYISHEKERVMEIRRFRVRGHGEQQHLCDCQYCDHNEIEWVEIDEVVEAHTHRGAEYIIVKREGDVMGDWRWLDGPKIEKVEG